LIPPPRKASSPENTDRRKRCRYHKNRGHSTEECQALKDKIEELVQVGHLQRTRQSPRRDEPTKRRSFPPQRVRDDPPRREDPFPPPGRTKEEATGKSSTPSLEGSPAVCVCLDKCIFNGSEQCKIWNV